MKPLKAYLNFLSYRVNRAAGGCVVDNFPIMAMVDPTMYCNLRCPACPTGAQAGLRPKASMPWELYQRFIDEVGDYLFKLYLYNLGEPLLHKQAPEMIRYAKEKDIFVMLSSNLSLHLGDETLRKLVQSGLDVLMVALDGVTPETYQQYRRGGDFELVKSNMLRIRELKEQLGYKTPRVTWQFLVFQHNEHEVATMCSEYRSLADEYFMAGAYMPLGDLAAGFAPSSDPRFNLYGDNHYHRCKSEQAAVERKPCSWLYGATVLNPNGKVSPCSYTAAEKDDFGDYAPDRGFSEVWNGERYLRARGLAAARSAAWQRQDSWDTIVHRTDGRGMNVSLEPGQLICECCPVPFLQEALDQELKFEHQELLRFIQTNYRLTDEERERLSFLSAQLN